MAVATRTAQAGVIAGKPVYRVTKTLAIPLSAQEDAESVIQAVRRHHYLRIVTIR